MKKTINKSIFGILALIGLVFGAQSANAAGIPTMSNSTATSISSTSAVLNGYYNDNGSPMTKVFFQYGDSPSMNLNSVSGSINGSYGNYSASVSGLSPNTTYYFEAVGINSYGFGYATSTGVFTTSNTGIASVSTNTATNITNTSATLSGYFNANGLSTQTYFEYGTSSSSLNNSTASVYQSNTFGNFTDSIYNLSSNTTYYYRAVTINSAGTTKGSILNFTTTGSGGSTGSCAITSFTTNTNSIYSGSSVNLSWVTTGCTYVNFGQSGGSSFPMSGSATVSPTTTSTYTLYAYGTNNNDTKSVTITVISNGGGNNGGWNGGCGNYNCNPCSYNCNTCSYNCGHSYTNDCSWYNCWMNNFQQDNFQQPCTWRGTCAPTYYNGMTYGAQTANAYYQNNSAPQNGYNNPVNNSVNNNSNSSNKKSGVYNMYENSKSLLGNGDSASDVSSVDSQNSNIDSNNLAAGAGFSLVSFLPSTLVGWLLFIIFVLLIIFIARKLTAKKENSAHGHGH